MDRMARHLFLFLIWSGACMSLTGQSTADEWVDVYPIRVNHKFGYIKIYHAPFLYIDTVIPPKYDYIGDINLPYNSTALNGGDSPYRLFELDEKVGLLDPYLNEKLPNDYKRIRVVADEFFAVELDSLFTLIDSTGRQYFEQARYEDICLGDKHPSGDSTYFFVKNKDGWGLREISGKMAIPHQFADIQTAGKFGFFKVRYGVSEKTWGLIDISGQKAFPGKYEDILALAEDFVAVKIENYWQLLIRDSKGEFKPGDSKYEIVERINDRLSVMVPSESPKVELWSSLQRRMLKSDKAYLRPKNGEDPISKSRQQKAKYSPWYFPLDEKYTIFNHSADNRGKVDYLIDDAGNNVSLPFEFIQPSGKAGVFQASRFGKWGIIDLSRSKEPVFDCQYTIIEAFREDIAICQKGRQYGALTINQKSTDSLPCLFEHIFFLDSARLRAPIEGQDVAYVDYILDENGKFREEKFHARSIFISKNQEKLRREAPVMPELPATPYQAARFKPRRLVVDIDPKSNQLAIFEIEIIEPNAQSADRKVEKNLIQILPFPERPMTITALVPNQLTAFSHREKTIVNSFTKNVLNATVAGQSLFDMIAEKPISQAEFIGFRSFDSLYQHTAFIDKDGQMGLIDRNGKTLQHNGQPLRFTYIGPFVHGRARVCIGGRLACIKQIKGIRPEYPLKFGIAALPDFYNEFGIKWVGARETNSLGEIYAVSTPQDSCKWAFIDTAGKLIFKTDAHYASDFYPNETAFIFKSNPDVNDIWGNPDAEEGVINASGEEIIPIQYSGLTNYTNYFRIIARGTPTFFFTAKGHEIFINETRLRPFSEGLAQFKNSDGRWGYVDTTGNIVIAPQFTQARPFSEGLAVVVDTNGYCVFINPKGKVALTTDLPGKAWQFLGNFKGGRCWFKQKGKDWLWGCIDTKGEVVIPPDFYYRNDTIGSSDPILFTLFSLPMDFSGGIAAVKKILEDGQTRAALIDTSGHFILEPRAYQEILPFQKTGLAIYTDVQHKLKGLLNRNGAPLSPAKYALIEAFVNGFAKVKSPSGKWGLINRSGIESIPTKYDDISIVSEGLIAVFSSQKEGWFYLDTLGKVRINGPFSLAEPFIGGVTLVENDGRKSIINNAGDEILLAKGAPLFFSEGIFGITWQSTQSENSDTNRAYYADASGNNLFGRYFEEISPFQLGVAGVKPISNGKGQAPKNGAINTRGVMVVPPKFNRLHIQPDGNIIINPQLYYGLLDKEGNLLLDPEYDRIETFEDPNIIRVERGEKIGYIIQKEGKVVWAWPLQN